MQPAKVPASDLPRCSQDDIHEHKALLWDSFNVQTQISRALLHAGLFPTVRREKVLLRELYNISFKTSGHVVIDHQRELLLGYQEDKIFLQGDIFIQLLIHVTVDAKSTFMFSSIKILRKFLLHRIYSTAQLQSVIEPSQVVSVGSFFPF